jgi:hypothetical protein
MGVVASIQFSELPARPFERAGGGPVKTNPNPSGSVQGGVAEFFPEYRTPSNHPGGNTH